MKEEYRVSWYIIFYKLLFGVIEFLLGVGITFFGRAALKWYYVYAARELSEYPHDLLVRLTEGIVPNVLAHHTFLVIYLMLLGIVKIIGAVGLIYKKTWGVDLLIGLTIVMFPFQAVALAFNPSLLDFLYVCLGLVIALYLVNFRPRRWVKRVAIKAKLRN